MRAGPRALAAAAALAAASPALAEWGVSADVERFRWSEDTVPRVTETGPMLGLGLRWTQDRPYGWRLGYRGRAYFGSVDYQGSFLGTSQPASGTTDYAGMTNEGQLLYRPPGNRYGAELVSGLVWDYWNRQLSPDQREEYWVASLRLGLAFDRRRAPGFFGGAGVKLPFWTREDAHLGEIGFNANARLQPRGAASTYAEVGYRFDRRWALEAYYDSYRFKESEPTPTLANPFVPGCAAGCALVQPASRLDRLGLRLLYLF